MAKRPISEQLEILTEVVTAIRDELPWDITKPIDEDEDLVEFRIDIAMHCLRDVSKALGKRGL